MTGEHKTVIFPQHERKRELTIGERIRNIMDASPSPEAGLRYVGSEFPHLSVDEIKQIIYGLIIENQEQRKSEEIELAHYDWLIPLIKEAQNITGRENITTEEAMKVLAGRGNEKAAAYLQHLTRPEARFWAFVTDRAIEQDPYWEKDGDYIITHEGATHLTPEALAHAYAKNHMDQILEDPPADLKEWLVRKLIENEAQKELDRLVEEGKFEIVGTEDGENIYRKKE